MSLSWYAIFDAVFVFIGLHCDLCYFEGEKITAIDEISSRNDGNVPLNLKIE